jgi:hypothetical protein
MFKLLFLFLFIFLYACRSNYKNIESDNNNKNPVVVKPKTVNKTFKCDTTINYDLENISSEGAEAQVCYTNRKINRAYVVIYGASGRVETSYLFNISSVEAIERNYKYDKPLSEIKSDYDAKLSDSSTYILSLDDGKIIKGKSSNQATEIYKEFLKTVALTIK